MIHRLGARDDECFFWATHAGAELDLLVAHRGRRYGFEFKRTDAPSVTASMRSAMETLDLDRLTLIHAGKRCFDMAPKIRAVAAASLLDEIQPLRR